MVCLIFMNAVPVKRQDLTVQDSGSSAVVEALGLMAH